MQEHSGIAKTVVIKTLAVIGFLVVIVFCVWLLVQVVRIAPSAFSSLASIADSLYNNTDRTPELSIATEKSIVNAGEPVRVSWTDVAQDGSYMFSYTCADGVTGEARAGDRTYTLSCTEPLRLPNTTTELELLFDSDKKRFIDTTFTLSFTATDGTEPSISRSGKLTIVNTTIPQESAQVTEEPTPQVTPTDTATTTEQVATTPEVETPRTATTSVAVSSNTSETDSGEPAATRTPIPQTITVPYFPDSDPNGFTDLTVHYLGIGYFIDDTFIPSSTLSGDQKGAIRFVVQNIGTKTSRDWTFSVMLPSGKTYTSKKQPSLEPGAFTELTLAFTMDTDEIGFAPIDITVDTATDVYEENNRFHWNVLVE